MKKFNFLLITLLVFTTNLIAQTNADDILGEWLTEAKDGKIQIYKQGNQYFGKIVGGSGPMINDEKNPDEKKRSQPLMGKVILTGFVFNGKGKWQDGEIYNPNNGKTYSCTIKLKTKSELEVRGYVGISIIGRTEVWTRIR